MHNNHSHGGISAISGITGGISNASLSSLGEASSPDPDVSPKTLAYATSDSPSPQSLTPNPEAAYSPPSDGPIVVEKQQEEEEKEGEKEKEKESK